MLGLLEGMGYSAGDDVPAEDQEKAKKKAKSMDMSIKSGWQFFFPANTNQQDYGDSGRAF